jgi:hypothetical protein
MTTPALVLPSGTAIPGATAALINILTAAFANDSQVQVLFGPLAKYVAPVTIQITETTGDQKPAELGPGYRREEKFNIVCSIVAYSGGDDYMALMNQAYSYLIQVAPVIGNNPTLIDPATTLPTVRFAEMGNFAGSPEPDINNQPTYSIDFQVRCSQRVLSLS